MGNTRFSIWVQGLPLKRGQGVAFMLTLPVPLWIGNNISGKKMYLAFRQISTKISAPACIFRSTITISLKKLVGIKSISSIQNSAQQDQKSNMSDCPLLLTLCGKPWDMQNFLSDCNGIQIHKHLVRK